MYEKYMKRILDIIICICGLPFFVLICVLIIPLIKSEDKGPAFYLAERIGKNGRIFKMYKFRSMKVNAPAILNADGSTFNSATDPRVTKIGKFIRETSIDETAQIINVLKGDMSIIGPRASLVDDLPTFLDDEVDKMMVRPGITGYTQAYFRNGLVVREKRLKDAWYANHVSFGLDAKIFLQSIVTVLKRENVYTNEGHGPEDTKGKYEPIKRT